MLAAHVLPKTKARFWPDSHANVAKAKRLHHEESLFGEIIRDPHPQMTIIRGIPVAGLVNLADDLMLF